MIGTAHDFPHVRCNALDDPYAPLPPLPMAPATTVTALAPPEPALLGPLAPGTITLIRGPRGVGKSWLALALARAVAAGEGVLGWQGRAAPVLHVDAAMAEAALGARLRTMGAAPPGLALMGDKPLDLGTTTDQARFIGELPEGGMLVLDGLALLMPPGRRAAERWRGFCDWLRMLRQDGQAVVLVDHTSRPQVEALADTLITLRPVRDGRRIAFAAEIVSRHALPAADRAFAVRLDLADGTARWTREAAAADPALQEIAEAARDGGTVRDIAGRLGLATATAWRRLNRARALGLVPDDKPGETGETADGGKASAPRETAPAKSHDKPPETGETEEQPRTAPFQIPIAVRPDARQETVGAAADGSVHRAAGGRVTELRCFNSFSSPSGLDPRAHCGTRGKTVLVDTAELGPRVKPEGDEGKK